MLGISMYNTIETLFKQGYNKSAIARLTGHDWKTISKVIESLKQGKLPEKQPHPNKLSSYNEQILEWLEKNLSGVRIHELLKEQGVSVSYSSVKTYLAKLKARVNLCIRFSCEAGEESQVDFGYVGRLPDATGKLRKAWVFNMRLSYSRLDFYQVVFDQKVETFIQCHMAAFRYFGGVPKVVKIDNLKAAILEAHFYQPVYQALYKQFATHYGFQILPCRVKQPQEKGKVESGIKYVKTNFFAGRHFTSEQDHQVALSNWLEYKANARIHGTTRKVPRDFFELEEKAVLKALPQTAYRQPQVGEREVYRDCHVYIDYNYYSVPYEYVGKTVTFEADESLIRIFYQGQSLAVHPKKSNRGEFSTEESHYPTYKCVFSTANRQRYAMKMLEMGEHAQALFEVLIKEQPYHWLQTVKGILSLRKRFDDVTINLSCRRALSYGAIHYRQLKSICESGCYRLPIDQQEKVH